MKEEDRSEREMTAAAGGVTSLLAGGVAGGLAGAVRMAQAQGAGGSRQGASGVRHGLGVTKRTADLLLENVTWTRRCAISVVACCRQC